MTSGPQAKQVPTEISKHGHDRTDPWFWMRDLDDPDVLEYLRASNDHTDEVLAHVAGFREALYEELLGRILQTDTSVMWPDDGWLYYQRTVEGLQYPIRCRRHRDPDSAEVVVYDQNAYAEGHEFHGLGVFDVSEDHRVLAYAQDLTGDESYTLHFLDLDGGESPTESIGGVYYSSAWANDNRTFYYTVHDESKRPWKLLRHRLGTDPADDDVVWTETDESMYVSCHRSKTDRFVVLHVASLTTSEVWVLDADDPDAVPRVVEPRRRDVEYDVTYHTDRVYIRVRDEDSPNFRLVSAPVSTPGRDHWTEVVPHRPDTKIEAVDAYRHHLVLSERTEGLSRLRIVPLDGSPDHVVDVDEPAYTVEHAPLTDFEGRVTRFVYTSLVTPRSWFSYDMDSRERILLKREPVLGGYNPAEYESARLWATAHDGARVPISVVWRKGMVRDGSSPCVLYGYGSYGSSIDPAFSAARLSLLDRGFVFAIAHVRGGSELGEHWHEDGKLLRKRNTFTDFVTCAEHLVAEGFTSHDRMAIWGGSAGGLLVGAVLNMRPDICHAAIADVPFVDVVTTILDESLPLTVLEWEEWGNPNEREYYDYILSYSPYDNVGAHDYPHLLVIAGLSDSRVSYWEPAKWVAKLRATKTDDNRLLLRTEMEAGHSGPSGRYDALREYSLKPAFLLDCFGLVGAEPR